MYSKDDIASEKVECHIVIKTQSSIACSLKQIVGAFLSFYFHLSVNHFENIFHKVISQEPKVYSLKVFYFVILITIQLLTP